MASLPISHLPRSSPVWAPGALPLLSEPTDFSGCKRQPGEALPRAWNALLSSCVLLQDAAMRLPLLRLSMKPRFSDSAPFPSSADPWGSPARTGCTSSILETPHFLKPGDYGPLGSEVGISNHKFRGGRDQVSLVHCSSCPRWHLNNYGSNE